MKEGTRMTIKNGFGVVACAGTLTPPDARCIDIAVDPNCVGRVSPDGTLTTFPRRALTGGA
jgi:hypothetical protein